MELTISELVGAFAQLLLFCLVPFVWWLCTAVKKENFFHCIGLHKGACKEVSPKILIEYVLVIAAYIGIMTLCMRKLPEGITMAGSQFAGKGAAAIPAVIAYSLVRTALAEEILFRGFLLKRISSRFGFATGNTVQALLFGLLHGIPFGLVTGNVLVTIILTLLPGAVGWFVGYMNEKRFEGSIIPGWVMHGIMNLMVSVMNL